MSTSSVAYSYFVRGFEAEMERSRALDAKTANLMGFTSVLSGLMIPFSALAEGQLAGLLRASPFTKYSVEILLILAVLLLFSAVVCFYYSSRMRGYKQPLRYQPQDISNWQSWDEAKLQRMLAEKFQNYWQHNKNHNDNKARLTQRGFLFLMAGGGVIVLSVCIIIGTSITATDLLHLPVPPPK